MFEAVKKHFSKCDCLIMAAAVSDYTPVKKSKVKIKKEKAGFIIRVKPTVDILKWATGHKQVKSKKEKVKSKKQVIVGFALEDRDVKAGAERKLRGKKLDMIIANTPAAIGSDTSEVWVKKAGGKWLRIPKAAKRKVAGRLIRLIEQLMQVD